MPGLLTQSLHSRARTTLLPLWLPALSLGLALHCANLDSEPGSLGFLFLNGGGGGGGTTATNSSSTSTTPGVTITESSGATAVSESSGFDFYSVELDAAPTADVTIDIAFDTSQGKINSQTTSPQQLTFTTSNWSTAQTVIVRAVDDALVESNHSSSITHSASSADSAYNGISVASITTQITDNDGSGITITESGGSTLLTEGSGNDTYDVVLSTAPTASVTVDITFDTSQVTVNGSGVSPVTLTFTTANWYTPQTVTLVALDDGSTEGTHTATMNHSAASGDANYNGLSATNVTASIADANGPGVSLTESSGSTTVSEGAASDSYTVVLTSAPTSSVTVAVAFDTTQLTVNGSSTSPVNLTFTTGDWFTAQTVTVAAVDDTNIEGSHSSTLTHTVTSSDAGYDGLTVSDLTAAIVDDDITPLVSGGVQTNLVVTAAASFNDAITAVDMSKAFVMCTFSAGLSAMDNVPTCQISSTTQVTIANGGGGATVSTRYYVMEFASGANVQRGSQAFASGDTTQNVTLGTAADTSKSFVIAYARSSSSSSNADEQRLVRARLTSSTNLELTRGESGSTLTVEWQVVELDGANVQAGTASITAGNTSTIAPLGVFDTSSSFLIVNHMAGNLGGVESDYLINGSLSSSTSLTFSRQGTAQQLDLAYYLVEMINGPNIQRGTINVGASTTSATATLSPAVNTSFTMPIINFNLSSADAASIDSGYFRGTVTATNTLTVDRFNHESKTCTVDWYTIELTSQ